jgi:hypothetical protein
MKIARRKFLNNSSALVAAALSGDVAHARPNAEKRAKLAPTGERLDARSREPAVATEAFAAYAANLKFSDLDLQTLRKAKYRLLDLIGCAVGGAPAAGNAGLVSLVRAQGGAPEASIIGYSVKAPAAQAAMSKLLDLVSRTKLAALPDGQTGIEITMTFRDGRALVERDSGQPSHYPAEKGSRYEELVAKFHQQVAFSRFVPPSIAEEIVRRIEALETETDMAAFVGLVTRANLPAGV